MFSFLHLHILTYIIYIIKTSAQNTTQQLISSWFLPLPSLVWGLWGLYNYLCYSYDFFSFSVSTEKVPRAQSPSVTNLWNNQSTPTEKRKKIERKGKSINWEKFLVYTHCRIKTILTVNYETGIYLNIWFKYINLFWVKNILLYSSSNKSL